MTFEEWKAAPKHAAGIRSVMRHLNPTTQGLLDALLENAYTWGVYAERIAQKQRLDVGELLEHAQAAGFNTFVIDEDSGVPHAHGYVDQD